MANSELAVVNPSTGEQIASLTMDDAPSAELKLRRARRRFDQRAGHMPLHERVLLLQRTAQLMQDEAAELALCIAHEGGKPLADARVEVTRAIAGVGIAVAEVSAQHGHVIPLGSEQAASGRRAFTQKFPRGVVLAFSAFNHPLNLIVHQVIPAFASGCPCVVKPAADTPLSCIRLVALMHRAGVPEDYVNCVITDDLAIAGALVASKDIAFFSFIGSARVGWMLRASLQPGVRCALEHGGIAPAVVCQSADLELAVPSIAKGGFYHAGQVCVSTQRVYVHESLYDVFVEKLCAVVGDLTVGNAADPKTDVGPLIRPAEAERIAQWVDEAVAMGAKVGIGGHRLQGNFYQPTVLLSPPEQAKVSQLEIFGPVVCVYAFNELEQALEAANLHPHAFQAAIYASDMRSINTAYTALDASAVMINDHTAFRDDAMPFAGLSESGLGVGGIPYTIEDLQFEKMMVIKHQ